MKNNQPMAENESAINRYYAQHSIREERPIPSCFWIPACAGMTIVV
jgi:hypothetical protein